MRDFVHLSCEKLEARQLLTGTWAALTNAVPSGDGAENAVVLSDGTIMVHGGAGSASNKWYKLTPTNGNYLTGTWTTLAASPTYRLFDATEVLTNGNVMVLGGEYSGTKTSDTFINTGEIYNPLTNAWTAMANFPQSQFGDDPTQMLPNGNVLAGYIAGSQTYIYNTSSNTWAATGSKLANDQSDEEAWVKLPNNDILSYNVFASISSGTPSAQYYNPSSGTWTATGTLPAQLSAANVGYELGPAVMLPNGEAFYGGGTNATAYYNPSTNSWTAGPNMPNNDVQADAPSAVLPNGDVLMAMSPRGGLSGGSYNFPGPTYVYEFNPTTGIYTNVTPSLTGFGLTGNAFSTTFLVLPTGQVAMLNDSGKIAVYTPSTGTGSSSWTPTISNITNNAGTNTFTLTGYQLNGLSEGAAYGDDNEMSSNYPIVQLTDQNGNITYARTFNWSLDGVASANSSVSFTEAATGSYLVTVIANGIASPTVLNIQCGASNGESFAIQADSNPADVDINLGEGGSRYSTFALSSFSSVIMTGDAANNTLVINANLGTRPTTINGGNGVNDLDVENNGTGAVTEYGGSGTDTFDFSSYVKNLGNITNFTTIDPGTGSEQVQLHDNNYSTGSTCTVTSTSVARTGFGGFAIASPVSGISLVTGPGADTVNVLSTAANALLTLDSAGGSDTVNIGNAGTVNSIAGAVMVNDSNGLTALNINDSADTTPHSAISVSTNGSSGTLTGLAPAAVDWNAPGLSAITLNGGAGSNKIYLSSAGISGLTTINTGTGNDSIIFQNAIAGLFAVNGSGGTNTVEVNDNDSTAAQSWLVNATSIGRSGFTVNYSSIASLSLYTGLGNDTVDIEAPGTSSTVFNDGGTDAYNVDANSMNLSNLAYALAVNGGSGGATLTLDDAAYGSPVSASIGSSSVAVGSTTIGYNGISTLTFDMADASGVVYVVSTTPSTAYVINSSSAPAELDLGEGNLTPVTSNTSQSQGGITFNANGASDELLLDSSGSATPLTYDFATGSVNISGQLQVAYAGRLTSLVLSAGSGTDAINVNSTTAGLPVLIQPSVGGDSVNVDAVGTGSAVAEFAASQQIGALTIGNGGLAFVPTGATQVLQAASVATSGTGTLDLTTNDLDVTSSTLDAVTALVAAGYNNGTWAGPGITSSTAAADTTFLTALGVVQNNQSGSAIFTPSNSFGGAIPGTGDVLVKYTYYGDANLDGKVDGSDYTRIDNGSLNSLTGWFNGDFDCDGVVTGSDYTLIDNAFNTQGASLSAQLAPAGSTAASRAARPAALFSQVPVGSPSASQGAAAVAVVNIADQLFGTNPADLRLKGRYPLLPS
jgi:hypothetical protein